MLAARRQSVLRVGAGGAGRFSRPPAPRTRHLQRVGRDGSGLLFGICITAMVMAERPHNTDAVIVGGGPAGLAAATALGWRRLEVVPADAALPPIDKACGEGLMPDGVAALYALGVSLAQHEHAIFRGIRFVGAH